MKTQSFALVALASSAQLASATFGWLDATKFTCPRNTDNKCVEPQKQGYNWAGSNIGSLAQYGDMDFKGFSVADSFDGNVKRDLISGRTFQNKCIKGRATPDYNSAPSFGCGSSKSIDKFSVKEYQVSVEFDCHLEFHYEMPNGSSCKQKQFCKKSGTIVKNTQCGGAKNVKIIYPPNYGGNKGNGCNIGFHHIDFDCDKPQNPPKPTPGYNPSTSSTTAATTKPSTTSVGVPTTTSAVVPTTTSSTTSAVVPTTTSSTTSAVVPTTTSSSSPTTTSAVSSLTTTSESGPSTTTPKYGDVNSTPSTTTSQSPQTTTTAKVYTPPFQLNTTSTTTTSTTSAGNKPSEPPVDYTTPVVTTSSVVATTTSEGPKPTAPCPDVLPQCLNTWLFSSTCKSNTDVQCFCESTEFVDAVYQCLAAYGASDEIVDEAQKYLQGICASHIPNNPAIITATNTLTITASQVYTVPVTTISVTTTLVVPCSDTSVCAPATSTISTALTVPQVVFQTITGTSTQAVSLVQGTAPASTGAVVTPTGVKVPVPTTLASVGPTRGAATTTGLQFTAGASKSGMTFGSVFAAGLVALIAM